MESRSEGPEDVGVELVLEAVPPDEEIPARPEETERGTAGPAPTTEPEPRIADLTADLPPPALERRPTAESTVLLGSLPPAEAVQALRGAEDWEEVLTGLALGAHHFLARVQIYLFNRGALVGYLSLEDGLLDLRTVRHHRLVLDGESAVSQVMGTGTLFVGAPPVGDSSVEFLHDGVPPAQGIIALVPVVVRGRVFCLLAGWRGVEQRGSVKELQAQLLRYALEAGVELGHRLDRPAPPMITLPRALPPTPLLDLEARGPVPPDASAAEQLVARFPGRLAPGIAGLSLEDLPPPAACSEVMAGLVALGPGALPALLPLIHDPDPGVRFLATHLLGGIADLRAVELLARQLDDEHEAVRKVALRGVRHHREGPDSAGYLDGLAERLGGGDVDERAEACQVLGALGDPRAVPLLLEALTDTEKPVARAARRALVQLTKQDFRGDDRRWRAWWEDNRWRERLEWMFDGLLHKRSEVRSSAALEIEEIIGHCFGYEPRMHKKERERIAKRCREWWNFRRWWAESGITEDPDRPAARGSGLLTDGEPA